MSAQAETEPHLTPITVHAAARMYGNYVIADLMGRRTPNAETLAADGDVFFDASMQFAEAINTHPQLKPDELGKTPEIGAAVDSIAKLPVILRTHRAEDAQSVLDRYAKISLLHAAGLTANRFELIPLPLRDSVYQHAVQHAVVIRDMLQRPSNRSFKQETRLQHSLVSATTQALLTEQGLALSALAHHQIDYKRNSHDGVLLNSRHLPVNAATIYAVVNDCTGFAEGHSEENRRLIRSRFLQRVRLLSVCCDLRLTDDDGPQNIGNIVELLQVDAADKASEGEQDMLHNLAKDLATKLLTGEGRKGTSMTPKQRRRASYSEYARNQASKKV